MSKSFVVLLIQICLHSAKVFASCCSHMKICDASQTRSSKIVFLALPALRTKSGKSIWRTGYGWIFTLFSISYEMTIEADSKRFLVASRSDNYAGSDWQETRKKAEAKGILSKYFELLRSLPILPVSFIPFHGFRLFSPRYANRLPAAAINLDVAIFISCLFGAIQELNLHETHSVHAHRITLVSSCAFIARLNTKSEQSLCNGSGLTCNYSRQ